MTDTTHDSDNGIKYDDYISVDNVIYIVMVDNKPKCYEFEHIKAKNKMMEYAKNLIHNNSSMYECYMDNNDEEIIISGKYRFFLISHEKVLHTISMHTIPMS